MFIFIAIYLEKRKLHTSNQHLEEGRLPKVNILHLIAFRFHVKIKWRHLECKGMSQLII